MPEVNLICQFEYFCTYYFSVFVFLYYTIIKGYFKAILP